MSETPHEAIRRVTGELSAINQTIEVLQKVKRNHELGLMALVNLTRAQEDSAKTNAVYGAKSK